MSAGRGRRGKIVGSSPAKPELVLYVLERATQFGITRSGGDQSVKVRILFNVAELVARLKQRARACDALAQVFHQTRCDRGNTDRVHLESLAKTVEVHDLLKGEASHISAAPRFDPDQALGQKAVECFANRGLADAELPGQTLFGEAGSLVEILVKDIVLDAVVCEPGQILRGSQPFHRIHHAFCHSNQL